MQSRKAHLQHLTHLLSYAALSLLAIVVASSGLVLLLPGCSPITRYRVLSFFFDGVPPPPGLEEPLPEKVTGPWGIELDPNDPAAKAILARATVTRPSDIEKDKPKFFHAPFAKQRCRGCHTSEQSFQIPTASDTCRKCHAPYYDVQRDDWLHGPVALGMCSICHESHSSEHDGLLTEAMPDICWSCHDASQTLTNPPHT